jgi:hypothetical protein
VVDQHDLLGPEQPLRDRQGADLVVGHDTKSAAYDSAFSRSIWRKAAPEADLRGGAQVCGGQTRVKPSNAPDANTVVATTHKLATVEAISRRRDLRTVASRCGKEVRVRRVLVVLLILGATFGVSPALAAHGKKPSSPGTTRPGSSSISAPSRSSPSRPKRMRRGRCQSPPCRSPASSRSVARAPDDTTRKPRAAGHFGARCSRAC